MAYGFCSTKSRVGITGACLGIDSISRRLLGMRRGYHARAALGKAAKETG